MSVSPLSGVLGEALVKEMSDSESRQAPVREGLSAVSKTGDSDDNSHSSAGYRQSSQQNPHREKSDEELLAELNAELKSAPRQDSPKSKPIQAGPPLNGKIHSDDNLKNMYEQIDSHAEAPGSSDSTPTSTTLATEVPSPEQTKQDLERILKLVVNNVKKQNTPEARFRKKVLASYRWTLEAGAVAEGQGLLYNLKA